MLYLLDANVLIDANRDYYPLERVPEFWDWLQHAAAAGDLKVPLEIYDEITAGSGDLVDWLKQRDIKRDLVFNEDPDPDLVDQVVSSGYAPDLSDLELNKVGRDPFLIAYALAKRDERWVITNETSKPTKQRANHHIPDVCKTLHVSCDNTFFLIRTLDFHT
jgi:hypothetical protein